MKRSFDALRAHSHAASGGGPHHPSNTVTASGTATAAVAIAAAAAAAAPRPPKQRSTSSLLAKLGRLGTEAAGAPHEWSGRLRRRHHERNKRDAATAATATSASASTGGVCAAIDDIESGVEITEEMSHQMLHDTTTVTTTQTATTPTSAAAAAAAQQQQQLHATAGSDIFRDVVDDDDDADADDAAATASRQPRRIAALPVGSGLAALLTACAATAGAALRLLRDLWRALPRRRWLAAYAAVLAVAWLLQVPAFVAGMLVCWCAMATAAAVGEAVHVVGGRRVRERFGGGAATSAGGEWWCGFVAHEDARDFFGTLWSSFR